MRATVFLPDYLIRMHTYSRRCRIQLYGFSRDTLYTYGITFVCMCMYMCMLQVACACTSAVFLFQGALCTGLFSPYKSVVAPRA